MSCLEETKFSTKPKRNGTNGTRKYIDKSLNQSGQNDSLIVATYFQVKMLASIKRMFTIKRMFILNTDINF